MLIIWNMYHNVCYTQVACWSSGTIPASGAGGPGFESQTSPKPVSHIHFCFTIFTHFHKIDLYSDYLVKQKFQICTISFSINRNIHCWVGFQFFAWPSKNHKQATFLQIQTHLWIKWLTVYSSSGLATSSQSQQPTATCIAFTLKDWTGSHINALSKVLSETNNNR